MAEDILEEKLTFNYQFGKGRIVHLLFGMLSKLRVKRKTDIRSRSVNFLGWKECDSVVTGPHFIQKDQILQQFSH